MTKAKKPRGAAAPLPAPGVSKETPRVNRGRGKTALLVKLPLTR